MPRRASATRRWKAAGKKRSSRPTRTRVGTSGQASSGQGSANGVPDCSRWWARGLVDDVLRARSCRKWVNGSKPRVPGRGPRAGRISRIAAAWPTMVPPLAAGLARRDGIIALTSTIRDTGRRAQTSGAVSPPIDWATSVTAPGHGAAAATTASAYSVRPAASSSAGRSTGRGVVAAAAQLLLDAARQYQAAPPGPRDQDEGHPDVSRGRRPRAGRGRSPAAGSRWCPRRSG